MRTREAAKPATPKAVESFERRFGLALPKAYREFLVMANGGRPERDLVTVPGCVGSPYARIHFFFGIGHPMECYDLAWNFEQASDLPSGLLPIATTEGADMLCLTPSGSVVFWDGYDNAVFPIAESFEGFLEQLYRDDLSPSFINGGSGSSSS
jgi:SMI1-KNR4 cell-wall